MSTALVHHATARLATDPVRPLRLANVDGNVTWTADAATAWFVLPTQRWAWRADTERTTLIEAVAAQYAALDGLRLHVRRTSRPVNPATWARHLDATSHPLPDQPSASTWADHLVAAQQHILANTFTDPVTYLGVEVPRRAGLDVLRGLFRRDPAAEAAKVRQRIDRIGETVSRFGLSAQPATDEEMGWLLWRSVGLGLPAPTTRDGRLLPATATMLAQSVQRHRSPYGKTVRIFNDVDERHVAVLTVGRMEPLDIPERHGPWLHTVDFSGIDVDLSSRVQVLASRQSLRRLEHRLRMIRSQQRDYADHGLDSPPELSRLAGRALHVADDIATGLPADTARIHGWHRIAVAADTRDECLERVREVIQVVSERARMELVHPGGQYHLGLEFIPGERVADPASYQRRIPVGMWAAALPQTRTTVGDGRGDLLGHTADALPAPVFHDPHLPMEVRERSGVTVLVAEPGGGKSTLMGSMGYLAARRGVQVTLLDPSGPLARLAELPELASRVRVLDLAGAEPGTLAPYTMVPAPNRYLYRDTVALEAANEAAAAERRELACDVLSMLLPAQIARTTETASLLLRATHSVQAWEFTQLEEVVDWLLDEGSVPAKELGELLLARRGQPLARLFFGLPPKATLALDAPLTVLTMGGLRLPDMTQQREDWSAEEALAVPVLHVAHRLAVRRCYSGDPHRRKLVGLDEAHILQGWPSGRAFLVRLFRDSRKFNLAALVASQNPRDILSLDVQNLVSTVFVGRVVEDEQVAADAIELLRAPKGAGYEQVLATLSQHDPNSADRLGFREFVMRDVDGRIQRIRVDMSWSPDLLRVLNTTPGGAR